MTRKLFALALISIAVLSVAPSAYQGRGGGAGGGATYVLRPARVFDGEAMHDGWAVVVRGARIDAAGPAASITVPAGAESI
jgi:hypothetical protein